MAIQKDPPARAKAIADTNFFNPSLVQDVKKFRTVRPVYSVAPIKEEDQPLVIAKPPLSNKKSVTFAEKLFEIREYEKNPEEWTSFVSQVFKLFFFFSFLLFLVNQFFISLILGQSYSRRTTLL